MPLVASCLHVDNEPGGGVSEQSGRSFDTRCTNEPSRCLMVLAHSAICASGDSALPITGIAMLRGQQLSVSKTCTTFV